MQRIHFDAADIARTRLRPTVGPLMETAFAASLLSRSVGAPYARWRSQVSKRLPRWSSPPAHGGGVLDPELLIAHAERYGEDTATASRPGELSELWQAAVAPYWDQLRAYLEAECEARGRIVMAGGVEQLLATLHPRMIWRSPVLEIPGGPDEDVHLDGRGLVLTPSVFLNHRPGRLMSATAENEQAVLAFAAPPDLARAAALWEEPDGRPQSLGALVGQTRAAALRVLRATCTTTQLADHLGISAAGASQHTAVLRETGLITTRRIRNTVLHTVTPLGVALLDGRVVRTLPPQNAVRQRGRSALETVPRQRHAS